MRGAPDHNEKPKKLPKPRKIGPLRRTINAWFTRLAGAASDGSLTSQEELYEADQTSRDYIWNTVGTAAWGVVFPILTIVATQLVGVEQAGRFSMAFVVGLLLMFVGNYGVRAYQVSDIEEKHSFSDYQLNRLITCIAMLIVGIFYCVVRGYGAEMFAISIAVYFYKMIDALADVYEGRLQQIGKLYLAGISQAIRSVVAIIIFSFFLLVTRNLVVACIAMAIATTLTLLVLTLPLAFFESPKSEKPSFASIRELFVQCFPLFTALFLFNLIDSMPKFVMEGVLSYDNQLYFNALYFPAQSILIAIQLVYKPQLVRMATLWVDKVKRKRFDIMFLVIIASIVGLTLLMIVVMGWIGVPLLSFFYGVDFEPYRELCYIMLVAGGVTAVIDFLYCVITVLRQQRAVTKLYLLTFGFALFIPALLVNFTGLPGIVISYLIVMSILMVLLVWEYLRIRISLAGQIAEELKEEQKQERDEVLKLRMSGATPEELEALAREKRREQRRLERERKKQAKK